MASLQDTKDAINQSHENIVATQDIIGSIKTVADKVGDESQQMTGVFHSCNDTIDAFTQNIDDSKQYFTDVSDHVESLKEKITRIANTMTTGQLAWMTKSRILMESFMQEGFLESCQRCLAGS